MKTPFLTIVILFLSNSYAQVGIANIAQAPILLHPSMVGSAGVPRANLIYSRTREHLFSPTTINSGMVSYDKLSKKLGSGLGAYLGYAKETAKDHLMKYEYYRYNFFRAGLAFAPKYTKLDIDNPNEVKYTFSPSLAVELGYNDLLSKFEYDGRFIISPRTNNYVKKSMFLTHTSLGGLFNSKSWLLGATVSHIFMNPKLYTSSKEGDSTYIISTKTPQHSVNTSVILGYTFPRNENSTFGASIVGKFSPFRIILTPKTKTYGPDFEYVGLNVRVKRVLLGYAYSGYAPTIYLGYKAKKWKATAGVSWGVRLRDLSYAWTIGEATFSYLFK